MSIRCGFTVGRTTSESSLSDQLKRYKQRQLKTNDKFKLNAKYINPAKESLVSKCIKVVVANFEKNPVKEVIPPPQLAQITSQLPSTLSPVVGGRYVYNENFWKRCCVDKIGWHNCNLNEHGMLWKQLYFEKLIQERLEDFDSQTENIEDLFDILDAAMDYIFTISFRQCPSHIDMFDVCSLTPNLSKLDLTYGVNKAGMNYERMLFGMKISDASSLAKVFDTTDTLTTLIMSGNMIDDDLLRMLMTGLIKNNTITSLDVSHNKITNHGARLISKLIGENSVITALNLSDNQIHVEGGRYLARGLRDNDSLLQLNLRLNRLTDDGCRLLVEGVQDNITLTDLNISANCAGNQTCQMLCTVLRDPGRNLVSLDATSNEFNAEHMELFRIAIGTSKKITVLDLRRNPGYSETSTSIMEIERMLLVNETIMQSNQGK